MYTKRIFLIALFLAGNVVFIGADLVIAGEEPHLPAGLEMEEVEPDLPAGLDIDEAEDTEPDLPAGLDLDDDLPRNQEPTPPAEEASFLDYMKTARFSGFIETRGGVRVQSDPYEKRASLGEMRFQLGWQRDTDWFRIKFTGDFIYDQLDNRRGDIDLRRGSGWFDLREAWVDFSPIEWMDVKLGRQALTWGTGDLLFLNDMFPKDWLAFFAGRNLEYLKAPSDAIKVSVFSDIVDLDLVYIPLANTSRFISGRRFSYYNSSLGRQAGRDAIVADDLSNSWFSDGAYAARLSKKVGSYELAAYGYWGFHNTPEGFDQARNRAYYPRLNTYGASIRGPAGRGIANFEGAYYDSAQDRSGNNPMIPNSQVRLLGGYEMDIPEIASELTVGFQYYVEIMMNHARYARSLPSSSPATDKCRQVVTVRLTKQLLNQNLTLGLFTYVSPTDRDAYIRPSLKYKIDDNWTVEMGGNIFFGKKHHTFFSQFERNSNVYMSLRYTF